MRRPVTDGGGCGLFRSSRRVDGAAGVRTASAVTVAADMLPADDFPEEPLDVSGGVIHPGDEAYVFIRDAVLGATGLQTVNFVLEVANSPTQGSMLYTVQEPIGQPLTASLSALR